MIPQIPDKVKTISTNDILIDDISDKYEVWFREVIVDLTCKAICRAFYSICIGTFAFIYFSLIGNNKIQGFKHTMLCSVI